MEIIARNEAEWRSNLMTFANECFDKGEFIKFTVIREILKGYFNHADIGRQ